VSDDIEDELFDDEGLDDFEGGSSFGDMIRENPLVKVGLVLGAFATIVGGLMLFGNDGSSTLTSHCLYRQ